MPRYPTSSVTLWLEKQRAHVCDNCQESILGVHYRCQQCPDYDLCEPCRQLPVVSLVDGHGTKHKMEKVRKPSIVTRLGWWMRQSLKSTPKHRDSEANPSDQTQEEINEEEEELDRTAPATREGFYTHDTFGSDCRLVSSVEEKASSDNGVEDSQVQANQRRRQGPVDTIITEAIRIRDEKTPTTLTGMTVDLVNETLKMWSCSECCKSMEARLDEHTPLGGWQLRRGILFALGLPTVFEHDFDMLSCGVPNASAIVIQVAIFLRLAQYVHERTGAKPELFAQEPRFKCEDKEVMRACGFKILETPDGQNAIDASTFVFGARWSWGLAYEVMGAPIEAQAGLLLASDLDGLLDLSSDFLRPRGLLDPDLRRVLPLTTAEYADYSEGKDAREVQRCYRRVLDARDNYDKFPLCANERACLFSDATQIGMQLGLHHFWFHVRKSESKGSARCHLLTWNSGSPFTVRKFDISRHGAGYGLVGDIWYDMQRVLDYKRGGQVGERPFVYGCLGFKYPSRPKLSLHKE